MKLPGLRTLLLFLVITAAAGAQNQFEILVLSIPNKYHYEYIPIARASFEHLAKLHQFGLTWTNDPGVFDGDLQRFAAIVFMNTTGEVLSETQRAKFQAYLHAGGSCVAVHKAVATNKEWTWYDKMVGRTFRIHPQIQTGVIRVVDRHFPAAFPLPDRWLWSDEWYEFDNPHDQSINVVLRADEATYDPRKIWPGQKSEGMGADHPVAWYRTFEGGRIFVSALGHNTELYTDPLYLAHLYGGLYWAATGRGIAAD